MLVAIDIIGIKNKCSILCAVAYAAIAPWGAAVLLKIILYINKPNDIINHSLDELYKKVNEIKNNENRYKELESIYKLTNSKFKKEWLLKYEIFEIAYNKINDPWVKKLSEDLKITSSQKNDFSKALKRGLSLIYK